MRILLLAVICLWGFAVALPPEWINNLTEELYTIGLNENLENGTVIGYLKARDPEGQNVTYSTSSDVFAVEAVSGKVTLIQKLDFKTMRNLKVGFNVTDSGGAWRSITHYIKIISRPVFFATTRITVRAGENTPVNRVLVNNITAVTSSLASEIELSCHVADAPDPENDACTTFRLDTSRPGPGQLVGRLILVQRLDFEQKRKHNLIIRARDNGSPPMQADTTVTIDVIDVQDTLPRFLNGPFDLSISDNTAKGTSVGQLQARDGDEGNPRPLVMRIISDPDRLFRLGPVVRDSTGTYTSVIYTNVDINRETVSSSYTFTVEIVEIVAGVESEARRTSVVRIVLPPPNDNSPTFNRRNYNVNVKESLERNAQISGIDIIVTDKDEANSGYFELEILNGVADGQNVFELSPAFGSGSTSVSLILLEPSFIDYDQPRYRTWEIKVVARETKTAERHSSTATVTINVQDVNDNSPSFQSEEYVAAVRENRRRGHLIKTITATDLDSGAYGRIRYSLLGDFSDMFKVNEETGEIFLEKQVDYEDKKIMNHQIKLTFRATDGGGRHTDAPLQISITNFNDEGPVFDRALYETTVGETKTGLDPSITISANDTESDVYAVVTYRIIRGNIDRAFRIHPVTGLVTLTRLVDYRETPNRSGMFNLVVEASDNGRPPMTATVTLRVRVTDENNHKPRFNRNLYKGNVSEVSPPGYSVVTVRATDLDFGKNAEVTYILESGGRDNFDINRETGRVQVSSHADLSIDKFGSQYNLIVLAVDSGTPVRTGTATVRIYVEDINNKSPSFDQDVYLRYLSEDVRIGTSILTVQARDPDQGSDIEYSILTRTMQVKDKNGNILPNSVQLYYQQAFRIDRRTGEIASNTRLDEERAGEITFTVQARDIEGQQPSDQVATAMVVITLNPKEYRGPVFQKPWEPENPVLRFNINEEEEANTLFATLVAYDPHNKQAITNFQKVQGSDPSNYFRVDSGTGQLFVNTRLDYETMGSKQLSFQVQATTSGRERLTALATIIVTVQDVNDNAPKFVQNAYNIRVLENATYPTEVGRVDAKDLDGGKFGTITYSISGQGEEFFTIHPTQGYITVAKNVTLDRETKVIFILIVTATDGFKKSTSVPMTITLDDINDNTPQFKKSVYYFNTPETVQSKSQIGQVTATDADEEVNGSIRYKFSDTSSQPEALARFVIDEGNGVITTKASLRDSDPNTYNLTVIAYDGGKPARTSTAQVVITVLDIESDGINFDSPRKDGQVFNISEDADKGTKVTQIKARDQNPGPAGPGGYRIRYGFLPNSAYGEDQSKFHIDPNTGVITVIEPLDREKKQSYTLMLHIRDYSPDPEEKTRRIVVNLTDVDDNKPSFLTCPDADGGSLTVEVREEQAPPINVTTVTACDIDSPPFNVIRYAITCGNDERLTKQRVRPFYIHPQTGVISTQARLDYETRTQYKLCVRAVGQYTDPDELPRDDPDNVNDDAVLIVNVNVLDVSDIPPSFKNTRGDGTLQAGLSSYAPFGTKVVQLIAVNDDSRSGVSSVYGISSQLYTSDGEEINTSDVFLLDSTSGWITTNVVNLHDRGPPEYFKVNVTARDASGRVAAMPLYIYLVRGDQSLRFVFDSPPEHTDYQALIDKLNGYSSPSDKVVYHVDSLRYHLGTSTGQVASEWERTDVCFHAVKNNRALEKEDVLQRFTDAKKRVDFKNFMYEMKLNDTISMCKVRMTTMWWGGYYWWWWWLIALALFIFLVALILIICICCFWDRYNRYRPDPAMPPIIVKGSTVHTIPNGSTARVQTSEYEWQEKVHIMN